MFGARPEKQAGFNIKKGILFTCRACGFQSVGPGSVSPGKVSGPTPDLLSGSTGGGALLSALTNPPQQVALRKNHCFRLSLGSGLVFVSYLLREKKKGRAGQKIIKVVKEP